MLTILCEWKLSDLQDNIVWVDTIQGEGNAATGNLFTDSMKKRTEMLIEDLFQKSFQALSSAVEVSEFAAKK